MKTGLERVAERAKQEPDCKFSSLAHHITRDLIAESLSKIPRSTASGVDKLDKDQSTAKLEGWLDTTITAIHNQGYRPPPVKRVYIPKPGNPKGRPIGIPTVLDRALQGAVSRVLNSIYEVDFTESSFGGRPNRSAHHAVCSLREAICTRKVSWVFEADLKNFFGSLSHQWLMKFIGHRISDPRILSLIRRWLKAGVFEDGTVNNDELGTPQGGPISVVLSNVYLHYVLDLWIDKVVKPRLRGEVYYFRYLDDFVICFQYLDDARRFTSAIGKRLAKFSLELEPSKTRLVEFGRYALLNSQKSNRKLETLYFLGFTIYCSVTRKGKFTVKLRTEKRRLRRAMGKLKVLMISVRHLSLNEQRSAVNRFLMGHYRYYGISTNAEALYKVYYFARHFWKKSLSRRSQKGRLSWESFNKIKNHHPFHTPKIYLDFARIKSMAVL